MTAKPQPKRNIIHSMILSALIEKKPVTRTHKAIDPASPDPKKPNIIETKVLESQLPHTTRKEVRVTNVKRGADGVYRHDLVTVDVPVPTLAGNVSDLNIERAARRWFK